MAGYDQHTTDPAADDDDLRLEVCPPCRAGEHSACEFDDCACDCGNVVTPREGEE